MRMYAFSITTKKTTLKWALFLFVALSFSTDAAEIKVSKSDKGWHLLVAGKPFIVKGMCYLPSKISESAYTNTLRDWMIVDDDKDGQIDVAYQSWIDKNRNNRQDSDEKTIGDFQLLKEMGCNAIRIYHHPSSKIKLRKLHQGNITLSHAPNKKLLRELYKKYGIRVVMGDLLGAYGVGSGISSNEETDYLNPVHKRNMMISVKNMVSEFKDEEFLLMWALGNENNYRGLTRTNCSEHPVAFSRFVNQVTRMIHSLDPNHPVCLVNGETQFMETYASFATEIDIFGLNSYPDTTDFGALWQKVAETYERPVLITEFGDSQPQFSNGYLNEDVQAQVYRNLWFDIQRHTAGKKHPGNAIGGFVFEFVDNWWQDGYPWAQDATNQGYLLEWRGIMGQGDGSNSPLLRQPRKSYYLLKRTWRNSDESNRLSPQIRLK